MRRADIRGGVRRAGSRRSTGAVGEFRTGSLRAAGSGGLRLRDRCGLWLLWWSTQTRSTRSRWRRLMISSQSRHSARAVPTKRSAIAFAFGARTGALTVSIPSLAKRASKSRLNLLSRSRIRKRSTLVAPRAPRELPGRLEDPGAGRVGCAAGEVDATAAKLDEDEHVQPLQRDRLDGEEVDCEHALCLCPQEGSPGRSASRADRTEPSLAQDLLHRRGGHREARPFSSPTIRW